MIDLINNYSFAIVVFGILIFINQFLFSLIPILRDKPLDNYLFNALIHAALILSFLVFIGFKNQKRDPN